jgi:hypothetical protein
VRFIYDTSRPGRVEFPWTVNPVFSQVVVYDETCKPDGECEGEALEGRYRNHLRLRNPPP